MQSIERNNFLKMDDLSDIFEQLKELDDLTPEPSPEEIASQKRYDEIIKKYRDNQ